MSLLDTLHFIRPWWFVALIPFAVLMWLLARGRFSSKSWEAVCDAQLLPFMLLGRAVEVSRRGFLYSTGLAGVLVITALAGPAWERLPQPVLRDDAVLVVVLDLSLSMDAVDVKPSRLARARFKINDLIARRDHGQTGLVVYARDAFTVVPITDDTAAIELYLQALDTGLMPRQGSRADLGLQEAGALLQRVDAVVGDVLLITDYADARVLNQAGQLNAKGYKVSVLGIGTESGGPVSLSSGEFLSHKGKVVVPRLDEAKLHEVAQAGGGTYVRFNPFANADIEALGDWLDTHASAAESEKQSEATSDVWREQGPWLILLVLPIAAFGFRRGLLVVVASVMLVPSQPAYALSWSDLWLRPDQQGVNVLEEGDAKRAAELFEDEEWKAAAQYRGGDFPGAVETLGKLDGAANWYNKANALVGAGKLKEAVEAYRHALEIKPGMEDAVHNMGVVEQVLQAMQQQMQQAQPGEEGEEGEKSEGQQAQAQKSDEQQEDEAQQNEEASAQESDKESGEEGEQEELADEDADEEGEASDEEGADSDHAGASSPLETMAEKEQAIEQWLRGVPDDPGRLLKRKLRHLSRNKKQQGGQGDKPW